MKLNLKSEIAKSGKWQVASDKKGTRGGLVSCHPSPVTRHTSAFTLVEMLLVLVILATLAAIVYPRVMGRSEQARITAAMQQIANFKTALDAFEVDNGYYPKGKSGLQDLIQQPRDAVSWHGPYLDSIPRDPWGNEYVYECPGKHNPAFYDIYSVGSPGADTPIGNWDATKR